MSNHLFAIMTAGCTPSGIVGDTCCYYYYYGKLAVQSMIYGLLGAVIEILRGDLLELEEFIKNIDFD